MGTHSGTLCWLPVKGWEHGVPFLRKLSLAGEKPGEELISVKLYEAVSLNKYIHERQEEQSHEIIYGFST